MLTHFWPRCLWGSFVNVLTSSGFSVASRLKDMIFLSWSLIFTQSKWFCQSWLTLSSPSFRTLTRKYLTWKLRSTREHVNAPRNSSRFWSKPLWIIFCSLCNEFPSRGKLIFEEHSEISLYFLSYSFLRKMAPGINQIVMRSTISDWNDFLF